eukprot:CAMPEP_0202447016 /NCGR_PEP_ID=MMETSP1360-20130828/5636_1 /ASSEMBLY_ACC=CAM_ASM_000848 /TAXON_ID=515479 /ORGANISM="Licmophora paradoxa, Strain CCMP2313" /LENGTH=606 /DNA_ID=CAMNT_0049063839 /DNA_START=158 /DNA_END=1978 /DNA_ORIENTATION=+
MTVEELNQTAETLSKINEDEVDKPTRRLCSTRLRQIGAMEYRKQSAPVGGRLGTNARSLGFGSSAHDEKQKVDECITSLEENAIDRKGRMLCHFYYREFLKFYFFETVKRTSDDDSTRSPKMPATAAAASLTRPVPSQTETEELQTNIEDDRKPPAVSSTKDSESQPSPANESDNYEMGITNEHKKLFSELYSSMTTKTKIGLLAKRNADKKVPVPCQTSILGALINIIMTKVLASPISDKSMLAWFSEYAYYREGEGGGKILRQDGNLALRDPTNNQVWRALVSYEAKLDDFDKMGKYESKSNAMDAISRLGRNEEDGIATAKPWPLLVIRHVLPSCNFTVFAMSPVDESTYKLVPMVSSKRKEDFLRSIVAACKAGKAFYKKVEHDQSAPDFCESGRNVCLQDERKIYKSFFRNTARKPNLDYIRKYVDPSAQIWDLGDAGSFLEMSYLGNVLAENQECSAARFREIATTINNMHEEGLIHGDIHLENLILGGEMGKVIDLDFLGHKDKTTYPASLLEISGGLGERHPDVTEGIKSGKIGSLTMKPEHDWYSFGAVLKLFSTTNESHQDLWSRCQGHKHPEVLLGDEDFNFTVSYSKNTASSVT